MPGADQPLRWTFLSPSPARPAGGVIAMFELVNAMARRGRGPVQVVHVPTAQAQVRSLVDLPWTRFEPNVEHHFATDLDPDRLPPADVIVYTTMLVANALSAPAADHGVRLVEALQGASGRRWLPILLLQGHGVFPAAVEDLVLRLPGPKVCVGSWLADLAVEQGVPAADVAHIPNGLDPEVFRVGRPIEGRPPSTAMNFDPHPVKRGAEGLAALARLSAELDVPGTVFGTRAPDEPLPPGLQLRLAPAQAELSREIYNEAAIYLQPSRSEGFGMCAVEAMACGCALVTTSNGGSDDYAIDGDTALLCGPEPAEMVDAMERLVRDAALRVRIAVNGSRFVERFRWPTSADRLADVASAWLAAPERHAAARALDLTEIVRELRSS